MRLMSPKKYTNTAAMAPTWITAVNPTTAGSSTGMPSNPSVILRCPVDETGRNSVRPSTTPRMAASRTLIVLLTYSLSPVGWRASVAYPSLVQCFHGQPQRRRAALQILQCDRNGQRGDPRLGKGDHAVRDPLTRPEQRGRVEETERDLSRRAGVVLGQVQVLALGGFRLVAHPAGQVVVEVLLATAHPAHVERRVRAHQ